MTIQQRLVKSMLNCLEEKGLTWDKQFKGSQWYVERIDQWNWKVNLLDWDGRNGSEKGTAKPDKMPEEKQKPEKSAEDKRLSLSDSGRTVYDLVVNNELTKKDMTYDSLKTVVSTLTNLSLDEASKGVQDMLQKKLLKVKDDKVEWLI
jgi:hypothetical protein